MRFAQVNVEYYCGVDLHAKEMFITVMNQTGNILLQQKMSNDFETFKQYLKPYLPDIAVAAESTCFYYWLADGCHDAGIPFYLGHALYMKAISGGKVKNDKLDSQKIADLLRANLFPLAYPYPREMRAVRDLLRRRQFFVRRRASAYIHLQVLCQQYGIIDLPPKLVKNKGERRRMLSFFEDANLKLMVESDLDFIESLDSIIRTLELQIVHEAKCDNWVDYHLLQTMPGVGEMFALIILYETHNISRFATVQRYSSYAGVVKCERTSGGKTYAAKNTKIRNAYLKWAFGEIIIKAQANEKIAKLYQRLNSKYGQGRAKSIIAHRFAVATYFMLKNKQGFDVDKFVQSSKYQ
jgi:transposase